MNYDQVFGDLITYMQGHKRLKNWVPSLELLLNQKLYEKPHGAMQRWIDALDNLPAINPETPHINSSPVAHNAS